MPGIAAGQEGDTDQKFDGVASVDQAERLSGGSARRGANVVTGSPVGDQTIAVVISAAVTVWAVVVILVWKPATLARSVAGSVP